MAAGDHSAWKLTGALGAAGEHGLLRFFKEQYSDNVRLKSMALKNTLGAFVEREVLNGAPLQIRSVKKVADFGAVNAIGTAASGVGGSDYSAASESFGFLAGQAAQAGPRKNTARFTEFQYYAIPTEYRTVVPDFWNLPHAYDWRDKKALLRDAKPDSAMLKSAMGTFERAIDRYILMALTSDVLTNDAAETTPGTTTTTFANDGGSTIDVNFTEGGDTNVLTGRSLSTAKMREAKRLLMENEAVQNGDPIICAVHPRQISHLLQDTNVKSHDFNTVRPLAEGQIVSWMGMTIIPTTQIAPIGDAVPPTAAGTDPFTVSTGDGANDTGRYVYCFTPDAVILGADPVITEMDVIPHKQHLLQIVHYSALGAVRTDGAKVVRIECIDQA